MTRRSPWPWIWLAIGGAYFVLPLWATLQFSLQARRGELSLLAYMNVLASPAFFDSFRFSLQAALVSILVSTLLVVPTAYLVQLRLPQARPAVELLTLLPLVVPGVVLVFGLIRTYNRTPLTNSRTGTYVLMIGGYVLLSLPYMYRSVDTGMRAINLRALTEAAQSLGASWATTLLRVILPNIYLALLSGAFITFAIVMGEFTVASLLSQPAFGPYINLISSSKVYEPSALAVISFALTWAAIAAVELLSRRRQQQR